MTGGATRYEILEPSGASLLGTCYKAWDRELERLVLLWLLPPDLFQDETERRRCLRLATAVAALHHPTLLPLYETGETGDGGLFQAFAWAEGETLARRLEAGPEGLQQRKLRRHDRGAREGEPGGLAGLSRAAPAGASQHALAARGLLTGSAPAPPGPSGIYCSPL
jgi:hypothetical protein